MKQLTQLYRACLLTVVIIFSMLPVSAQLYIADNLIGDSISVEEANLTDGIYTATDPVVYTSIANGESVKVIGFTTSKYKVENDRPVIEYNGKTYVTGRNSLKFSPENSSDVENTIHDAMQSIQHSALGHFFYTVWPFMIVFLLTVIAGVLVWMFNRSIDTQPKGDAAHRINSLYSIPALLLTAAIIEVAMLVIAGSDCMSWCFPSKVGFWKSLLYVLPAFGGLVLQITVGIFYKRAIENLTNSELSWKSVFWGIGISLPLCIIAVITLAILNIRGGWMEIVSAVALLGSLAIGFLWSLHKNTRQVGIKMGLAFTVFSFIYALGVIIAVCLLLVIVWKLFLVILPYLIMAGAVLFLFAFGLDGKGGTGPDPQPMVFRDKHGGVHTNGIDCEAANRRIDERANNW